MKRAWMMVAALVVVGMLTMAAGAQEKADAGNKASGKVTKIDGNDLTLQGKKDSPEQVVKLTETTKYVIVNEAKEETAATKDDVVVGKRVLVELADGNAATVKILPERAPKEGAAKDAPKKDGEKKKK